MAGTFSNVLLHVIVSTKHRTPQINADIRPKLHAYMGGILREMQSKPLAINGTDDHVHLLISLHTTISVSELVRVVKTNSSKWMHDCETPVRDFAWQSGYGVFSVSQSNVDVVAKYIADQEEHHRAVSFQEEFVKFLERHGIAFDPKFIWE